MIYLAISLTLWNIFNFDWDVFFNGGQVELLPEGNYTMTASIFSDDQEYYGEDCISMTVVDNKLSIDLRSENKQEQCIGSTLYAVGTFDRKTNSILVSFSKVIERKIDKECLSGPRRKDLFYTTKNINEYIKNDLLLVSTYRNASVQCFESEVFGGLCFNKE